MTDKIRFFIGTDRNGGCAECQMVLEYSIQKHCSVPYEIHWMAISEDPTSFWHGWNTTQWSTPFSGFRYGIPEFCNFEGKAIYQDDDQMWLGDPAKLWNTPIDADKIMTGKLLPNGEVRHCVSLIDCAKAKNVLPPIGRRKHLAGFCELMKNLTFDRTQIVDPNFNNYDGEHAKLEDIKVLHFTDMRTNPGVKLAVQRLGSQAKHWFNGQLLQHRRQDCVDIFNQYYNEALNSNFNLNNYIPNNTIAYHIIDQSNYQANNGYDVALGQ
jgi:hypothetical protein